MNRNFLPILILILAVVMLIYAAVDYFMMDAELNYWWFLIGIILLFLGIALLSRARKKI